jgi:hypothetical protein
LSVNIDLSSLQNLIDKLEDIQDDFDDELTDQAVDAINENIVPVSQSLCPIKSGALRNSIHVEVLAPLQMGLVALDPLGFWMEEGTRPHLIEGHPILHWQKGGQDFFASIVHHPGTRPYLFLHRGIDEGLDDVIQDLTEFLAGLFTE